MGEVTNRRAANARFFRNIEDARDNGYDLVCAQCGMGMTDDDFENVGAHDTGCPNAGRDRAKEMTDFLAKRLGPTELPPQTLGEARDPRWLEP